jgi:hypothetical protein
VIENVWRRFAQYLNRLFKTTSKIWGEDFNLHLWSGFSDRLNTGLEVAGTSIAQVIPVY